jgi:hypothetical protein
MLTPATALDLPELEGGAALTRLVSAAIKKRRGAAPDGAVSHAHWSPAFFGLDRVSAFAMATAEQQAAILEQCGQELLAEAFYIEKSGMAFAAKMVLLAESTDERKLYALFAGDEAAHLDAVAPFYRARAAAPTDNPFLALLSEVIDEGDRRSLQLVIQVVLEGWGLSHYRRLRQGCSDPSLQEVLGAILADEAAHHGSGVLLLGADALAGESHALAVHVLTRFLALVQAGPLGVVAAVEATLGPASGAARRRLYDELDAERHAAERLGELRALLDKCPAAAAVTDVLARAGAFSPHFASETA